MATAAGKGLFKRKPGWLFAPLWWGTTRKRLGEQGKGAHRQAGAGAHRTVLVHHQLGGAAADVRQDAAVLPAPQAAPWKESSASSHASEHVNGDASGCVESLQHLFRIANIAQRSGAEYPERSHTQVVHQGPPNSFSVRIAAAVPSSLIMPFWI